MTAGPRVLITGGTGALGSAAIRAFAAKGWQPSTLSRHAPPPGSVAASYPHVAADITDVTALGGAMAGAQAVVHMAARLHVTDPAKQVIADYERINVDGTRAVMQAAEACGIPRVVYVSSICVYGRGAADERTAPLPDTLYARTKLDAERIVLGARRPDGESRGVVLRFAAVYGAGLKGNYHQLVRAIARRRFVMIGKGENRRTLVFEDDAGRALVVAATHPRATGRTYNVTDGRVHSVAEIVAAISGALGRKPPRVRIPLGAARLAVGAAEFVLGLAGLHAPVTRVALDKYVEDVAVSGRCIHDELGFVVEWSLNDGWARTVAGMRALGRL